MRGQSADGERSAARGYQWQYDHAAALVYDALLVGDFDRLRLADPTAGQVDDLVLIRGGRLDAYQFKSAEYPRSITFKQILDPQRARGGGQRQSMARALAAGWRQLLQQSPDVHVHLVTQHFASTSDRVRLGSQSGPRHFAAFLNRVLVPIREGELDVGDVGDEWRPALRRLREASGLSEEDFVSFLASLHVDVATGPPLPSGRSHRRSDIESLSSALQRAVAESAGVVDLDTADVLELARWSSRTRLRGRHEFPVDLDTYVPLSRAVDELQSALVRRNTGYVAVVGPPGAGKSTLGSVPPSGGVEVAAGVHH